MNHMDVDKHEFLSAAFKDFDTDNDGFISAAEMQEALKKIGMTKAKEELAEIIENVDYLHLGKVNYREFMVAVVDLKEVKIDGILIETLHKFDMDEEGYITESNLKKALHKLGTSSEKDIATMVEEFTFTDPSKIHYAELKMLLLHEDLKENEKSNAYPRGWDRWKSEIQRRPKTLLTNSKTSPDDAKRFRKASLDVRHTTYD